MEKICGKCKLPKPLTEFHKNRRSKDGLQDRCKECHKQDVKAAYAQNPDPYIRRVQERAQREPEKIWRNALRQRAKIYGLDPDMVEAAFNVHDGLCDLCGKPPNPLHERHRRLHIDHDHAVAGHFRGFLCHLCNSGLGGFKDNPVVIAAAIRYLAERAADVA